MTISLVAAALSATLTCTTPDPGAGFVCHQGQWLPPNHPSLPKPQAPAPAPAPEPPLPCGGGGCPIVFNGFQVGHTYRRDATGAELYMVALGTIKGGLAVLAAQCLTVSREDGCLYQGEGRFVLANANTLGWTRVE